MSEAPAADYAVCILETLARNPVLMGISDISRETGINKNAVSRVLSSLVENGWVYQEELKYQMTLKPFRMASSALRRITFCSAAQPVLTRLWEQTGDNCYIGVLHEDAVLYLGHIDSRRDLRIAGRVGGSYPLLNTAPGKVLLAYARESYREQYLQTTQGLDGTQAAAVERSLADIRRRGWALDDEEYGPGILCFAAPVFDIRQQVVGTIGISTSTVYCDQQQLIAHQGALVLAAAREISEKLGAAEEQRGD